MSFKLSSPTTYELWGTLFSWVFVHSLGRIVSDDDAAATTRSWIDEWLLGRLIARVLHDLGLEEHKAEKACKWSDC